MLCSPHIAPPHAVFMSATDAPDVVDLERGVSALRVMTDGASGAPTLGGDVVSDAVTRRLEAENARLRRDVVALRAHLSAHVPGADAVLNAYDDAMSKSASHPELAGYRTDNHEFVVRDVRKQSSECLKELERQAIAGKLSAPELGFGGRLNRFWSQDPNVDSASASESTRRRSKAAFELALVNDESAHVIEPLDRKIRIKQKGLPHVKFSWLEAPKNAFLVKKINDAAATVALKSAVATLKAKGVRTWLEPPVWGELAEFAKAHDCLTWDTDDESFNLEDVTDFVVVFGGDGTILWASKFFPRAMPPVVPISMGSLGFLTAIKVDAVDRALNDVCLGDFTLTVRSRLMAKIVTKDGSHGPWEYCLNEVLVDRGPKAVMIELDLAVDGRHVTKIAADGVILSTPTGSTAYGLAAGGSVVHPGVPALCVTPICPHSLSFRPIILPDSVVVTVSCPVDARHTTWAAFDGQKQSELQHGDSLVARVASFPVPIVCAVSENTDWFDAVKQGLLWNARGAGQKPF